MADDKTPAAPAHKAPGDVTPEDGVTDAKDDDKRRYERSVVGKNAGGSPIMTFKPRGRRSREG